MIDKLIDGIKEKGNPSVAGLDPTLEMVPDYLREEFFAEYGMTARNSGGSGGGHLAVQ